MKRDRSGPLRTTNTSSGRLRPRDSAISRLVSLVAMTVSAVANVSRSLRQTSR